MKKLVLLLLFFSPFIYSQVGVNTTNPKTTLEVVGQPSTTSVTDGIIPPKLQRSQLIAKTGYGVDQTGAMVYITDTSGTTNTATAKVTSVGFYYWDGDSWEPIGNSGDGRNIYTENGTLTSNRTVIQDNNSLAFTSTVTNGFSVDGTTFSVDAANNRIGIGTATPTAQFHTTGTVRFSGAGSALLGRSLVSDAAGNATWQNPLASNSTSTAIVASSTQVAVPSTDVQGAISDLAAAVKTTQNSTVYTSDGSLTGNRIVTQNANTLAFTGTATNGFSVDGTTFSVDAANDRVGIGTSTPTTTLDVGGNFKIYGNAVGDFSSPEMRPHVNTGSFTVYTGVVGSGTPRFSVTNAGSVGVGTLTPTAQFHTTGTVRFSGAGTALLGRSLVSDAAGNATWQNPLASNLTSTAITASATQVAVPSTNVQGAISDLATAIKTTQNSTIYTADGTLSTNRTVTQGSNTLAFNSTAVNGFNVDGSTFSIDTSNDRVGIGNIAPNLSLDITAVTGHGLGIKPSNVSQWDHLFLSCDGSSSYVTAGGAENGLQFRVGSGSAGTYGGQTYTTAMTMMPSGNVGIGTATPATKLDVAAGTTTTNTVVNAKGSINDFLQFNVQNTSTGTQAQSGYSATADNGSATTGFAWMGINNSTFNYPTAYNIGLANDVSFVGSGQDLYLANANNTKSIIFSTGKSTTPFFNERMRITNAGNVGIGTTNPQRGLELNSVSLSTPPMRFTQQTANTNATNTSGNSNVLIVDSVGDVKTMLYNKEYNPGNCSCLGSFPYTLPANFTFYGQYDGNWSGNGAGNTTVADFVLPTVANALAAGHRYGSVVVVYRASGYNVVVGTSNTDLPSNVLLGYDQSLVFVLTPNKWKRINSY